VSILPHDDKKAKRGTSYLDKPKHIQDSFMCGDCEA